MLLVMGNGGHSGDARGRIRASGGYRDLRSFQLTTIIYDATVAFCDKFIDQRSRLVDQMVQAARSGRQNIAEGSRSAATSSQTELRLINVARASLDELLLDYEDFLRQRGHDKWPKDSAEALRLRAIAGSSTDAYSQWLLASDPSKVANALICLIHQANYLLDRQITALERAFIADGGYSERLAAERIVERGRQSTGYRSDQSDPIASAPRCPNCGKPMALCSAKNGCFVGFLFWACSA